MSLDLFAPITPICDQLSASIDGLVSVGPASLLTGQLIEITQRLPGIFVRPLSSEATGLPNIPTAFKDDQLYEIVVAVPCGEHDEAPELWAGPIAGSAIEALAGFAPTAQFQAMEFKGFSDHSINVGYAEFPLRFSTRLAYSKPK
jgi:hypothetical protein